MLAMPRGMSVKLREKTVPVILKETEDNPKVVRVSPTTVMKHFAALNSLMRYAKRNGLADGQSI
jgi:hypothetical protein